MTKEQFIALGLTEEQATQAAQASANELTGYVPKADYTTLEGVKGTLETQLGNVESLVKTLVKDAKGSTLEEQANNFQQSIQSDKEASQKQLDALRFDHALDKAMTAAKARNSQAVKALLKQENLKLNDDGSVTGLDEQLKAIQKSDAYLFADDSKDDGGGTGSLGYFPRRDTPPADNTNSIGKRLAEASKTAETTSENPYFK